MLRMCSAHVCQLCVCSYAFVCRAIMFSDSLIETHDYPVRTLAKTLGLAMVSVVYRRAPAHPHPAQLDDVTTALRYLVTHAHQWGIDPERILVAGTERCALEHQNFPKSTVLYVYEYCILYSLYTCKCA